MDLCCFNRPFDDQSQPRVYLETEAKLFIQRKIKDGKIAVDEKMQTDAPGIYAVGDVANRFQLAHEFKDVVS